MPHPHSAAPHDDVHDRIRRLIAAEGGLAPAARRLGVPRSTLANVFAGAAREGSRVLIETRLNEIDPNG